MRRSIQFMVFTTVNLALFSLLPLHARIAQSTADAELIAQTAPLRRLQLTDLCLSSEARYTRHLSQADRHAPFQEHPLALEHFPSGSMILPSMQPRETP
ncbi:MAG: hypothetical protein Q7V04_12250 [Deltaproteobacteria bacterium]|nr:hypothetical protein [Deltaproteobacteria bacterium]